MYFLVKKKKTKSFFTLQSTLLEILVPLKSVVNYSQWLFRQHNFAL